MNQRIGLTDDELGKLDEWLLGCSEEEGLSIDEAHGYYTGIIVSNVDASEAELIEAAIGRPATGQEIELTDLLLRMYQSIADELQTGQTFEPLVIEEEDEDGELYEVYEGWCFGFMLAVSDFEDRWAELDKSERELLEPIATLSLLREEELDMDDEEYSGWVELLPGAVVSLYDCFR